MIEKVTEFSVFNLPVHLMDDYTDWLAKRIEQKLGTHVVTLNSEMTMMALSSPELTKTIQQAELVIPDGSGIIFYLWRRGKKQKRCPGIELASSLLEKVGKQGENCPICFYGGSSGVAEKARQYWQKKIPEISIMTNHGFLSETEQQQWYETLQAKQPKLILVALGVPRQEAWIMEHRYLCPNSVWIGVGGSLDIWAGVKNRAPRWLRDNNLEWSYRLYKEPWRWKRMLALPKFFVRTLF
jgi:N-acetylglucosaminyldiphosphoundecaprenol N-acetyl-beta-D-mannosaminyltransferase